MKKLLSIFLAMAMLVSLIPTVFAADAGIKIVYDFTDEETFEKCEEYTQGTKTGVQIDPTLFTYTTSKGFWEYAANSQDHNPLKSAHGTGVRIDGTDKCFQVGSGAYSKKLTDKYWIAFKLYVPKAGTYKLSADTNPFAVYDETYVDVFVFEVGSVSSVGTTVKDKIIAGITASNRRQSVDFSEEDEGKSTTMSFESPITLNSGEYYFVFKPTTTRSDGKDGYKDGSFVRLLSLTLTENGTGTEFVPIISSLDATTENGVTTVKAKAELMSDAVTTAEDATITYSVAGDDAALAKVNAETGVVTGLADGTATIIATATKNGQSSSKSIEVAVTAPPAEPEEDEKLSDAFDDAIVSSAPSDYIAPSVDAIDAEGIVGEPVKTSNGAYRITAPETAGERGNFLYWKKAMTINEKIVSFEREFNYVPEGEGRNILVAVYEGDVNSTAPKCYNANGQYLPDAAPIEADLPSMAGYGRACGWNQYKDTNVYVAKYEAETPISDIDVTVVGDNANGGGTNLAYGEEVTCSATGENFKCWMKTYSDGASKIVSVEEVYTFKAWEDCTVTAIYEENVYYTGSKMKMIIDSFTAGAETGVMAEFIGFGSNVVEKGIMVNDDRIAMTTPGNQFSIIADEEGTYKGYVIIDDDGLKLITDGSYEHTK